VNSSVSHGAQAQAAVNAAGSVTLYAPNGKPVHVTADDADYWIAQGFTRALFDPKAALAQLEAAAKAVIAPARDFTAAIADGVIDPSDEGALATFSAALEVFGDAAAALLHGAQRAFPVVQGAAVELTKDDRTIAVDPGQEAQYRKDGWK
jgi:hypothetical protein